MIDLKNPPLHFPEQLIAFNKLRTIGREKMDMQVIEVGAMRYRIRADLAYRAETTIISLERCDGQGIALSPQIMTAFAVTEFYEKNDLNVSGAGLFSQSLHRGERVYEPSGLKRTYCILPRRAVPFSLCERLEDANID